MRVFLPPSTPHNTHTVSPLQFQKKNKLEKRSLVPCSKTAIPFALTKGGIHSERRIQADQQVYTDPLMRVQFNTESATHTHNIAAFQVSIPAFALWRLHSNLIWSLGMRHTSSVPGVNEAEWLRTALIL